MEGDPKLKKATNIHQIYTSFKYRPLEIDELEEFYLETEDVRGGKPARRRIARMLEKELGDSPLAIGIDYVPQTLGSETATSVRRQLTGVGKATTAVTQNVQVDFDNLYTIYLNLKMGENLYAKAGYMSVDVVTNESLGTGSRYNDGDMNGTLLGFGYNNDLDNGMFVRVEGNYMTFDGLTLTATNNAENQITLNTLDGASAKISVGKSF